MVEERERWLREIRETKQHRIKRKKDIKEKQVQQTTSMSLCKWPSHWLMPSQVGIWLNAFV